VLQLPAEWTCGATMMRLYSCADRKRQKRQSAIEYAYPVKLDGGETQIAVRKLVGNATQVIDWPSAARDYEEGTAALDGRKCACAGFAQPATRNRMRGGHRARTS